jgi:hypothetical protein
MMLRDTPEFGPRHMAGGVFLGPLALAQRGGLDSTRNRHGPGPSRGNKLWRTGAANALGEAGCGLKSRPFFAVALKPVAASLSYI